MEAMQGHPNEGVRRYAELIRSFLAGRGAAAEPGAAPDRGGTG